MVGDARTFRARCTVRSLAPARSRARRPRSPRPRRRSSRLVRASYCGPCGTAAAGGADKVSLTAPVRRTLSMRCGGECSGRYKKRVLYTRRFVNAVPSFGKPRVRPAPCRLASRLWRQRLSQAPRARDVFGRRTDSLDEHGGHPGREARRSCRSRHAGRVKDRLARGRSCRCMRTVYSAHKNRTPTDDQRRASAGILSERPYITVLYITAAGAAGRRCGTPWSRLGGTFRRSGP